MVLVALRAAPQSFGPLDAPALQQELVAAPGAAARAALLAGVPEPLGFELGQSLARSAERTLVHGTPPDAQRAAEAALAVAERYADPLLRLRALWLRGQARQFQGDSLEAETDFQTALDLAAEHRQQGAVAGLLEALAANAGQRGQLELARQRLERAERLAAQAGDPALVARLEITRGELERLAGRPEESQRLCADAAARARRLDDARVLAAAANCLGVASAALGDYGPAVLFLEAARQLAEQYALAEPLQGALHNLGFVHQLQGNLDLAAEHYAAAARAARDSGRRPGLARALLNTAGVLRVLGRTATAREAVEEVRELAGALHDAELEAAAGLARADLALLEGRWEAARTDYERLLAAAPSGSLALAVRVRLARACLKQGAAGRALDWAREAGTAAEQAGEREVLWTAHSVAGQALAALGRTREARQAFERAVEEIERLYTAAAGAADQLAPFLDERLEPYRALAAWAVDAGRPEEGLAWAERTRGRALADMLRQGRATLTREMTAAERDEERALAQRASSLAARQRSLPEAQRAALAAELEDVRRAEQSFRARLFAAHPRLRALRAEPQPLSSEQLGGLLGGPGAALVEYLAAGERLFVFLLIWPAGANRPALHVARVPASPAEVERRVLEFRERLESRDLDVGAAARELYDLLLRPLHPHLAGVQHLVVVPEGRLWDVPFAALSPARGHFLVERVSLAYLPAAWLLPLLREGPRGAPPAPTLLAIGNPDLGGQDGRARLMGARLEPLPEAERQARRVAALYGAGTRLLVGAEATETAFKATAGRHRVLHLATHGLASGFNPLYSQLVLALERPDAARERNEDGLLEAREVLALELRAELAILAACRSARGRAYHAEGLVGFAWAFFAAGCPSVLASQWDVDAASTGELMVAFHRGWRAGRSRAAALAAAQRSLLRRGATRHPFFWASFVLVGDDR